MATVIADPTKADTALPDDALYEVVDGVIVEHGPMGTYQELIAGVLFAALFTYGRTSGRGRATVETLFDLTQQIGRKRRPDVAFVLTETRSLSEPVDEDGCWNIVPDLAVEITSPTNSFHEITEKISEYFEVGSKQVWVVNPSQRNVYVYESETTVRILQLGDTLTAETLLPGFEITLHDLFETDGAGRRDEQPTGE